VSRLTEALERRRRRRAKLPWGELDAEAARQGVSPADIFFDRAGRPVPGLAVVRTNGGYAGSPAGSSRRPALERRTTRR
jgi:hypothetical protein